MSYTKQRYITYILLTAFIMVVPFITINGNHLLLLSFERLEFHFLGFAFNVDELFIMPFLLMLLFIGIFALTAIFGRVWCGWACPQTIFRVIYRDLIEGKLLGLHKITNKQKSADLAKPINMLKKIIAIFIWSLLSILVATNFILYFVPSEDFFSYLQNPSEHMFMILFILSVAGFLIFDILLMKESFCVYVCPYSRVQTILYDDDTKQVIYNTNRGGDVYNGGEKTIFNVKEWSTDEECTTCEACVKVCPTHIDIRKGLQIECINCLECSDACSKVMGALGKNSLIEWGSTNSVLKELKNTIFTKRNNMYFVSLALTIILAFSFANKQQPILAHLNKTTTLYNIKDDGKVTNNYILTLHNNKNRAYTYDLELNDDRFFIKRFRTREIGAKKEARLILIISSKEKLDLNEKKDTILDLGLKIYAKEDSSVAVYKKLVFIYPSSDSFK